MDTHSADDISLLLALPLLYRLADSTTMRKHFGFTRSQLFLLAALHYKKSMTMTEAANFLITSKEHTTRAVAPLVEQGYIERYTLPENRRHVHIRLTADGDNTIRSLETAFSSDLSEKAQETLSLQEREMLCSSLEAALTLMKQTLE